MSRGTALLEDYLLLSVQDLRKKLGERQSQTRIADEELQAILSRLPDRERLAIRAMFCRDLWHIAKLYLCVLTSSPLVKDATGARTPQPQELDEKHEIMPTIGFKETLFG